MDKIGTVHTFLFDLYEFTLESKETKEKLRKIINRSLEKEYRNCNNASECYKCPQKKVCKARPTWNQLSALEQRRFAYITIKDTLFKYVSSYKKNKINDKIQKEVRRTFFEIDKELDRQNKKNATTVSPYFSDNATDIEKRQAYKQFCEDYKILERGKEPPKYENWIEQNKSHHLRPYDYIMDVDQIDEEYIPINDTIINTIVKILKNEFNIEIDLKRITDCLTFLHNYELGDEFGELLVEYDESLPLSKDEQERIISINRQYIQYKKMLEELNFYEKKERG